MKVAGSRGTRPTLGDCVADHHDVVVFFEAAQRESFSDEPVAKVGEGGGEVGI